MENNIEEIARNYADFNAQSRSATKEAVKFGYELAKEHLYSEEEVLELLYNLWNENPRNITEWFNQYKKK